MISSCVLYIIEQATKKTCIDPHRWRKTKNTFWGVISLFRNLQLCIFEVHVKGQVFIWYWIKHLWESWSKKKNHQGNTIWTHFSTYRDVTECVKLICKFCASSWFIRKLDIRVLHKCRKVDQQRNYFYERGRHVELRRRWQMKRGPRSAGQLGVIHEPHCTLQAATFIADLMVCLISF